MNRTPSRSVLLAFAVSVLLAACGGGSEVGSGVGVNEESDGSGALRDSTTTTAPVDAGTDTTAPPTTAPPATAPPTTAAPATTTTAPAPQNIIRVQDDRNGPAIDPRQFQIPQGGTVTWHNTDDEPRQVVGENDIFVSPEIPPGGMWSWTANVAPQVINYRDVTRPYAVSAQLQVY